jgi:hypothetical protein
VVHCIACTPRRARFCLALVPVVTPVGEENKKMEDGKNEKF